MWGWDGATSVGVGSRRSGNCGGEAASEQRNQPGGSHGGAEKAVEEEEALRFVCLPASLLGNWNWIAEEERKRQSAAVVCSGLSDGPSSTTNYIGLLEQGQ